MGISDEKKKWLLAKFGKAPEAKPPREKTLADIEKEWLARSEPDHRESPGPGGAGQVPAASKPGPTVRVCMGFDLGTSCSKVVVRAMAPRFAIAASFPDGKTHGLPCLLPTRLFVRPDGFTSVSPLPGIAPVVDLKTSLMANPFDTFQLGANKSLQSRPVDLVASYLGHAIRMSRTQFVESSKDRLPANSVRRWSMNLGIPARNYDDPRINEAFALAARAGWLLSATSESESLAAAARAVDLVREKQVQLPGLAHDDIATIPEVTAEATGYARSSLRQFGTHLMIDIGATTLDACLFILFERNREYCYTLLDADVNAGLGAIGLQRRRMDEVATLIARANPFHPVSESVHHYLREASNAPGLEGVDDPFKVDCVNMLRGVVFRAKKKAPNDLNEFLDTHSGRARRADTKLRVIVCGGGARVGVYSSVIPRLEEQVRSGGGFGLTVKPFEVLGSLPKPSEIEMPEMMEPHFDRLAVAYGLSFPVDNIGHFIPPSQVDDAPLKDVKVFPDMTTKDAV